MRLAVTLVVWAVALMFLASLIFTFIAIFVPSLAYEAVSNPYLFGPPGGPAQEGMVVTFGGVAVVLFGMLLVVGFVGALLRRQPITQSRQVRGQMEVEEARIMQEIYRSLGNMEKRIESLETILLERGDLRGANRVRAVE